VRPFTTRIRYSFVIVAPPAVSPLAEVNKTEQTPFLIASMMLVQRAR
jgi:hypothetical protein